MKNKFVLIITIVVAFFACQPETEIVVSGDQNLTTQTRGANLPGGPNDQPTDQTPQFEKTLAWTAYVTGLILFENPEYRLQFETLLDANNTIELADLIGSNSLFPEFKDKFEADMSLIADHWDNMPEPDRLEPAPEPPLVCSTCGLLPQTNLFHKYLKYILLDNCVELYFPNRAFSQMAGYNQVVTVAHPLENVRFNKGLDRSDTSSSPLWGEVTHVIVDDLDVSAGSIIVVARPIRIQGGQDECEYSQYSNVDFTQFLD